jgi:transcriptional regulator with XRE-family HTH domain
MDLVKIGKYIAKKRTDAGMTQRQLADMLGMSDKSVSKWERGICLPDVSVYSDLCRNLGTKPERILRTLFPAALPQKGPAGKAVSGSLKL